MLRDGFLRFCDDPEPACCRAEAELGQLRIENAKLKDQLFKAKHREQAAVHDIELVLNKCTCGTACHICANGDCDGVGVTGKCEPKWRCPAGEGETE